MSESVTDWSSHDGVDFIDVYYMYYAASLCVASSFSLVLQHHHCNI